jgi:hypothetical protein
METPTFLYKPNFCAECGEKIERESWHFWTSRSFCDNCEPVFRLQRILPSVLIGVFLIFGSIFFAQIGQIGQKKPKTLEMIPTRAAITEAGIEKAQTTAPKEFPAANQPASQQNSVSEEVLPKNTSPANTAAIARSPFKENSYPISTPETVYTCGARTQKGTPCSRRVKTQGTRCWQHAGKPSMLEKVN